MWAPVMLSRLVASLKKPKVASNVASPNVTPSRPGLNPKGSSRGRYRRSTA
jgi:hypothetical protein